MPPSASTDRANNLPAPLTPLVGREREIGAVAASLRREDARLLTLTGPGGVGKTRLALAVAAEVADSFADGVRLVSLAPLTVPTLVAPTIAQVLGVRESADAPLLDRLTAWLGNQRLLLVLDNFEQVVEAAPLVTDLLTSCPSLIVLVTSRVRLRLSGEREYAVAPLGLPTQGEPPAPERVAASDAVRLFVERARAAKADFALTAENAGAVAGICGRLDGLPLAIELAAARVKVLPAPALLARLEKRLPLLAGGGRDLPARQQTMRGAIAWSYDLLTPEEQAIFRRLSIFVGGFLVEAAEAVAGTPGDSGIDPFEGVASLVDKSLLRQDAGLGSEPRFAMLETVREFGLEQLAASGEEETTRHAHAAWCMALADRAWKILGLWTDVGLLDRVEADYGNLRAALGWLDRSGDSEGLLRLAGSLSQFWHFHSHRREGREWLERALDPARSAGVSATLRVRALFGAGLLARNQGDYGRATKLASEYLALSRDLGNRRHTAFALYLLGYVALAQEDYDRATADLGESLALCEALDDRLGVAGVRGDLGLTAYGQGDLERATALLEDALTRFRELADPFQTALTLGYLGLVACDSRDHAGAAARFSEALPLWQEVGTQELLAEWLAGVATLATTCGSPEQAARIFGAADALRDALGHAFVPPEGAAFKRGAGAARAALGDGAFAVGWEAGRGLPLAVAIDEASSFLSSVADSARGPEANDEQTRAGLTPREVEVLHLLVDGRSDREIAAALFIGPRTVQTHVANLFAKLGVHTRAEAAAIAVRRGLA